MSTQLLIQIQRIGAAQPHHGDEQRKRERDAYPDQMHVDIPLRRGFTGSRFWPIASGLSSALRRTDAAPAKRSSVPAHSPTLFTQPFLISLVTGSALLFPKRFIKPFDGRKQRHGIDHFLKRMAIHGKWAEWNGLVKPQRVLGTDGGCCKRRRGGSWSGRHGSRSHRRRSYGSGSDWSRRRGGRRSRRRAGIGHGCFLEVFHRRPAFDRRVHVPASQLVGDKSPIRALHIRLARDAGSVPVKQRIIVDVTAGLLADIEQAGIHLVERTGFLADVAPAKLMRAENKTTRPIISYLRSTCWCLHWSLSRCGGHGSAALPSRREHGCTSLDASRTIVASQYW